MIPGHPHPFLLAGGGDPLDELGVILRAIRLRAEVTGYLTRTPGGDGNRTKWTVNLSIKRAGPNGSVQYIFGSASGVGATTELYFGTDEALTFTRLSTGVTKTNQLFRDYAAHTNIHFVWDTNNATVNDRIRIYKDGARITSLAALSTPNLAEVSYWNAAGLSMDFGAYGYNHSLPFNGLFSNIIFVDGQALGPSAFGLTHPRTGQWRPKTKAAVRAAVAVGGGSRNGWGTNGVFLPMDDLASLTTLGHDRSQSDTDTTGNNFTPVNVSLTAGSTYDSLTDTSTDNHQTFNSLDVFKTGTRTLSAGNLELTCSLGGGRSTIPLPSTGKWVFEGGFTSAPSGNTGFGIGQAEADISGGVVPTNCVTYNANGQKTTGGAYSAFAATFNITNVIRVEADMGAKTAEFFKDGASQGTISFASLTGQLFFLYVNPASVSCTAWCNFGQRPLAGTPTTGFKKYSTKIIDPKSVPVPKSESAFVACTDTGANIIATLAAAAPFANWIKIYKRRDAVEGWRWQFSDDSGNCLDSSSTAAKAAFPALSGTSYVAYALKVAAANGVATGRLSHVNGVADTVTDSLGNTRKAIILKNEATGVWYFYHPDLTAGKLLYLEQTVAETTDATIGTVLSNSFVVAAALATGTYRWIALAEVDGFLKLFKHSGNSSTDGAYDSGGMTPALAMLKSNSYAGSSWPVYDFKTSPYNEADAALYLNSNGAEQVTSVIGVDLVSSGIKQRNSDTNRNASGHTYVGLMIAAFPFRYANA